MTNPNGYQLSTWSAFHTPVAATQATITFAGVTDKRHVAATISGTLAAGATAQAAAISLQLLSGPVVIWQKQVIVPANGVWEVSARVELAAYASGDSLTLRFSAAGAAGTFESVAMTGFTIDERN